MKPRDLLDLIVLAALWGGSFLFMRVAAPEFGPVALIEIRVLIAAIFLVGVLALRGGLKQMAPIAVPLTIVAVFNSALPFCLFAYATLSVTAGFASILNATTPLFGACIAYVWLRERLSAPRIVGLAIGLLGVVVLVWGKASFKSGGSGLAIVAGLAASLCYGIAACYTKRRLTGVDPMALATGSMVAAAVVLAPFAWIAWPVDALSRISGLAWISVIVMGVASTGFAYILYFRLIANVGPARAISVTFLIPVFAILWGALFLHESLTMQMLIGAAVVLVGIALATGVLKPRPSLMRSA